MTKTYRLLQKLMDRLNGERFTTAGYISYINLERTLCGFVNKPLNIFNFV